MKGKLLKTIQNPGLCFQAIDTLHSSWGNFTSTKVIPSQILQGGPTYHYLGSSPSRGKKKERDWEINQIEDGGSRSPIQRYNLHILQALL